MSMNPYTSQFVSGRFRQLTIYGHLLRSTTLDVYLSYALLYSHIQNTVQQQASISVHIER